MIYVIALSTCFVPRVEILGKSKEQDVVAAMRGGQDFRPTSESSKWKRAVCGLAPYFLFSDLLLPPHLPITKYNSNCLAP
jgi:hypothetical protein